MKLFKLLWQRYKVLVLTVMIVIVGSFAVTTANDIHQWNQANVYLHSEKFAQQYTAHPDDFDSSVLNDDSKVVQKRVKPISEIQKRGTAKFWNNQFSYAGPHNLRNMPLEPSLFVLAMILVATFVLLVMDTAKNFNSLLFASRYKRISIFWTKLAIIVGLPTLLTVIGEVLYFGAIYLAIPNSAYNVGGYLTPINVLAVSAFFIFGIGLIVLTTQIIGQTLWALILIGGFGLSTIFFAHAVSNVYLDVATNVLHMSTTAALSMMDNLLTAQRILIIVFVVGVIGIVFASILYSRFSFERNGDFVMFEKLKWPLWITTLVYTTFSISEEVQPWNNGYMRAQMVYVILTIGVIVFINAVMFILIFKPRVGWWHRKVA
ncbi:hypothetical protein EQG49_11890 [Periweissella cryptocerci]|uniref:ABC transporter permease n=1 Tax=Periweissella cryptocerci TaxID=2506420 RepID=A0A4V1AIY3_9LACO|nr:hypothetical protein [Periweissella cryptocerci]QBO37105.1 hypothetical protein EQG49_11890 [Periweissella cryptocerci]